jgi:hypothetical protein
MERKILRLGWMPSWRRGSAVLVVAACGIASAQAPQKPAAKVAAHRASELTLAGLQPGKDTASRAVHLYQKPKNKTESQDAQMVWGATCQTQILSIDLDAGRKIQVVRTVEREWSLGDCLTRSPGPWKTGRGLRVGDPEAKVLQLYGEPDSRSPSSKDGRPLELLYYAFDWAGPDVPQVMEVLCTKDNAVQAGRVVEITLAAPSL